MKTSNTPKKPVLTDWHRADIKAALEKAGWSLRKLSVQHGLCPEALTKALSGPYPNAERIIAETLGKHPKEIWPTRYDVAGNPIRLRNFPLVRPKEWAKPCSKRKDKDTGTAAAINGNLETTE